MTDTCILVANSSRARIFLAHTPKGALKEVDTLTHPESRLHERDLTSDLPGRAFDSLGQGRHSMEQHSTAKKQEAINFAHQIRERLQVAHNKGEFDKLVLVAAPAFLGLLREHLSSAIKKQVVREIDKDLSMLDAPMLHSRLLEK